MKGRRVTVFPIARGGAGVLNFCAVARYTRLLLPEEYGRYALLMASAGVVSAVSFQWLRAGARRFLQACRHKQGAFLALLARTYLLIVLALAVLAGAAAVVVAAPWLRGLILLGLGLLIVQGWLDLNLELLLAGLEPVGLLEAPRACGDVRAGCARPGGAGALAGAGSAGGEAAELWRGGRGAPVWVGARGAAGVSGVPEGA